MNKKFLDRNWSGINQPPFSKSKILFPKIDDKNLLNIEKNEKFLSQLARKGQLLQVKGKNPKGKK